MLPQRRSCCPGSEALLGRRLDPGRRRAHCTEEEAISASKMSRGVSNTPYRRQLRFLYPKLKSKRQMDDLLGVAAEHLSFMQSTPNGRGRSRLERARGKGYLNAMCRS